MAKSRWLTEQEQRAWRQMTAVLELLPSALDAHLVHNAGLTHFEYFTLTSLSEAPGRSMRTSALSRRTNATLPRLSRVLTGLEQKGLVERRTSQEDRRARDVVLTDEGWARVVQAAPGHVAQVRRLVFDQVSAAQVEQLTGITARLLERLDPAGEVFAQGD